MTAHVSDRAGTRRVPDGKTIAKSPPSVTHEIVERDVGPSIARLRHPAAAAVPAMANTRAEQARSAQERIGIEA